MNNDIKNIADLILSGEDFNIELAIQLIYSQGLTDKIGEIITTAQTCCYDSVKIKRFEKIVFSNFGILCKGYIGNILVDNLKVNGFDKVPVLSGMSSEYGYMNSFDYMFYCVGTGPDNKYYNYLLHIYEFASCCGSGYCGSTDAGYELLNHVMIPNDFNFKTEGEIPLTLIEFNNLQYLFIGDKLSIIIDEDGGDSYYPCGGLKVMINECDFIKGKEYDEIPTGYFVDIKDKDLFFGKNGTEFSTKNKNIDITADFIFVDNFDNIEVIKAIFMDECEKCVVYKNFKTIKIN